MVVEEALLIMVVVMLSRRSCERMSNFVTPDNGNVDVCVTRFVSQVCIQVLILDTILMHSHSRSYA